MFLVDYHTHTRCSPDSTATLAEMVEGAARAGLQEICTTDHCDLIQPGGGWMDPWDWTPILEQYRRMGGYLVTLGSDAHTADRLGTGLAEATALLKQLGFRHCFYYENRIAIPYSI